MMMLRAAAELLPLLPATLLATPADTIIVDGHYAISYDYADIADEGC